MQLYPVLNDRNKDHLFASCLKTVKVSDEEQFQTAPILFGRRLDLLSLSDRGQPSFDMGYVSPDIFVTGVYFEANLPGFDSIGFQLPKELNFKFSPSSEAPRCHSLEAKHSLSSEAIVEGKAVTASFKLRGVFSEIEGNIVVHMEDLVVKLDGEQIETMPKAYDLDYHMYDPNKRP
ncbi:hypothetical protein [Vibrio phage vB_VmeM-Yong XC32]|nr:hypothetical protein [Vibrio phage vB_VmeM-Yong XC31]QAX96373.1 hypothetical protein [Vibrio phage vB_VmeM-Yong XC32]QAX96691.1 hypothetical protein [Vibrio phage vB_VmeM-Yong MS31]QAX97009.1 hypothetical protein [Vibrio phage vB_VmeM-Yong MS32]